MQRRDFIKVSSAAGLISMAAPVYGSLANLASSGESGFDLHPFIKAHPEAVFINLTSIEAKSDSEGIYIIMKTYRALPDELRVIDGSGDAPHPPISQYSPYNQYGYDRKQDIKVKQYFEKIRS